MRNIITIAGRELRSMFCSPLAWVLLAAVQAILGWMFLLRLKGYEVLAPSLVGIAGAPGVTVIVVSPVLKTSAMVLLMMAPLITMRSFAEERRSGTLSLLLSAPISMSELALGKFVGNFAFVLLLICAIAVMPLSLLTGATLDLGLVAAGLLGLILIGAAFCSAGLYFSSLTTNPSVAAAASFGLLLLLWIIDLAGTGANSEGLGKLLAYFSLTAHLDAMLRGVIDTRDVSFYILFTATFLFLCIRRLDRMRLVG
jgi:ABC-2 type transport system permease protein